MEKKINIVELLKDCPKGMELYSPIFGEVYLDKIRPHLAIVVTTDKEQDDFKEEFLYDGRYGMNDECMLFPSKYKTTWEGFHRPFKDGDIVFYNDTIAIFKEWGDETLFRTYVTKYLWSDYVISINIPLFGKSIRKEIRFATEEEKQKLFQAIKANGYKWNEETKTLEKLFEPKFKVGDRIKSVISSSCYTIVDIKNDQYFIKSDTEKYPYQVPFSNEINYELVPNKFDINTLVPFESRVLVRNSVKEPWKPDFFGCLSGNNNYPYVVIGGIMWKRCIPYKNNEHLLWTTNNCDDYYKTW